MINIIIGKEVKQHYEGIIIGVDVSAAYLVEKGHRDFLAIGDFDSCSAKQLALIEEHCKVIKHPKVKDLSDLALAIDYGLENFPNQDISIHNVYAGNRLDHLYANILLLKRALSYNVTIYLRDYNNCAYILKPGKYGIASLKKYISFFALKDISDITLENFKYPLANYKLEVGDPLCVSNQLEPGAKLSFTDGLLLVIESRD